MIHAHSRAAYHAEEWRAVIGYEDLFEVSSLGRVRRIRLHYSSSDGGILQCGVGSAGYPKVGLNRDNKRSHFTVHRLVAEAFLGTCPHGFTVNHIDGVKTNNVPENLEYISRGDNSRHAQDIGLFDPRGESNGNAKLDDEKVLEMRRLRLEGWTQTRLAKHFKISQSLVSAVCKKQRWAHV